MRTIIIGVTGASSSGKSTVAVLLQKILPFCEIIHQDDFFKPENEIPFDSARGDRDWDCPNAIDIEALKQTIEVLKNKDNFYSKPKAKVSKSVDGQFNYSLKSSEPPRNDTSFRVSDILMEMEQRHFASMIKDTRFFLIDGFLLLNDVELIELFDFTIFFRTDYQTLKNRRQNRVYTVEGNTWVDPPGYFDSFVWPGYYLHHKILFVEGHDEDAVKKSGGILLDNFKENYRVFEFENNDNCGPKKLLQDVLNVIVKNIGIV